MSDDLKLRLILVIGVLFIGSIIGSCTELKYALNSEQADAKITKMYESRASASSRRGSSPHLVVHYRFTDRDGEIFEGYDRVSVTFTPEISIDEHGHEFVAVQYRPGSSASRLVGTEQMFWIYILVTAGLVTIGGVVYVWIDYRKYEKASAASTSWR